MGNEISSETREWLYQGPPVPHKWRYYRREKGCAKRV